MTLREVNFRFGEDEISSLQNQLSAILLLALTPKHVRNKATKGCLVLHRSCLVSFLSTAPSRRLCSVNCPNGVASCFSGIIFTTIVAAPPPQVPKIRVYNNGSESFLHCGWARPVPRILGPSSQISRPIKRSFSLIILAVQISSLKGLSSTEAQAPKFLSSDGFSGSSQRPPPPTFSTDAFRHPPTLDNRACKKFGFVDGKFSHPGKDSDDYEDLCVISWIRIMVEPNLQSNLAHYDIAFDLWEHIRVRYSIKSGQRVQWLKTELATCRHKGLAVETYYGKLMKFWSWLSDYQQAKTMEDMMKEREEYKLHQFLMGLDEGVSGAVKSSLLSRIPLLTLDEAYNAVALDEESKQTSRMFEERVKGASFAVQSQTIFKPITDQYKAFKEQIGKNTKNYAQKTISPDRVISLHPTDRSFSIISHFYERQIDRILNFTRSIGQSTSQLRERVTTSHPSKQEIDWETHHRPIDCSIISQPCEPLIDRALRLHPIDNSTLSLLRRQRIDQVSLHHPIDHPSPATHAESLYGLRQAPKCWFAKLSTSLKDYGLTQSVADYSLFTFPCGIDRIYVLVYVDNLILSADSLPLLEEFKNYLSSCFHKKNLGVLKYFIGIEVARIPYGFYICQRKYAMDIIIETSLAEVKPVVFPLDQNHKLALASEALEGSDGAKSKEGMNFSYLIVEGAKLDKWRMEQSWIDLVMGWTTCVRILDLKTYLGRDKRHDPNLPKVILVDEFLILRQTVEGFESCVSVLHEFWHRVKNLGLQHDHFAKRKVILGHLDEQFSFTKSLYGSAVALGYPEKYRRLVGCLIYLGNTCPNLAYLVHILTQFMQAPRAEHWDIALRVVRYIKHNPGQSILPRSDSPLTLNVWCDADFSGCPLTRRSLTGWFVQLGNSPIFWKTTIPLAANPVFHERTKHVERNCHFVRDEITRRTIITKHVSSKNQLADIMTKALGCKEFEDFKLKMGICDL
uniref:Putative retroelement polyprotein n=1 Tax=Leavenworthia alabamica TaxID=310722 RepID=R9S7H2_LEAAL|nr:putative retroelement polyprotein [Leavenworthia alabamica]